MPAILFALASLGFVLYNIPAGLLLICLSIVFLSAK